MRFFREPGRNWLQGLDVTFIEFASFGPRVFVPNGS